MDKNLENNFGYEFLKFMSCILFNVMTRVGSDQHNGIIDD